MGLKNGLRFVIQEPEGPFEAGTPPGMLLDPPRSLTVEFALPTHAGVDGKSGQCWLGRVYTHTAWFGIIFQRPEAGDGARGMHLGEGMGPGTDGPDFLVLPNMSLMVCFSKDLNLFLIFKKQAFLHSSATVI